MEIKYELDRIKDQRSVLASIVAMIIKLMLFFLSEDRSEEPCLKGSMGLTILRFYGLSVLVLQLSDAEFILCTFITMLFLRLRYVNELCKQLKKKFPLASQTAEDNSAERDNVVHIYYKVLFNNPLFVF